MSVAGVRPREGRPPTTEFVPDPLAGMSQTVREGLVTGVVVAGAIAVLALWWQDTAARSLHTVGDELTAAGRVTGLLGTYLLLVQLLLMARVPWLDRLVGMDRLAVWHRRNGEYVVGLLTAHAVTIVFGYALVDHVSLLRETRDVVLTYPDMLAAVVALGLLVAIGVSSARAVRARMRYHTWYFLHLYAYLALALGFAHQLATGTEFIGHPLHRTFWIVLHVAAVVALVGYRVVTPVRSALRHQLRVARVVDEGPGFTSVYITGHQLEELRVEPGQFFLWRFVTREGWWQAHPFSLSAAPDRNVLRITVKAAGDHTSQLGSLQPGTRVVAEGPYGALTGRRRSRRKVTFVAGGIGVTPLRALLESVPAGPKDLTFVYRAGSDDQLVLRSELEDLARRRWARLAYVVGGRNGQADPLSPERFRAAIPDIATHDVYVCGPPGFVDTAAAAVRAAGVPRRHIHTERFEL